MNTFIHTQRKCFLTISNYCIKIVYSIYWPKESKHWKIHKGLYYYTAGMGTSCLSLCELAAHDLFKPQNA